MDLIVYETGNGGDIQLKGGDLAMTNSLLNQVYLSLFGGNVEQTTIEAQPQPGEQPKQRFDWWANQLFFEDRPANQMNSLFERTLTQVASNSAGRSRLEAIAKKDSAHMSELSDVTVSVTLESESRVKISVKFTEPKGIGDRLLVFLWDGTKLEEIENIII